MTARYINSTEPDLNALRLFPAEFVTDVLTWRTGVTSCKTGSDATMLTAEDLDSLHSRLQLEMEDVWSDVQGLLQELGGLSVVGGGALLSCPPTPHMSARGDCLLTQVLRGVLDGSSSRGTSLPIQSPSYSSGALSEAAKRQALWECMSGLGLRHVENPLLQLARAGLGLLGRYVRMCVCRLRSRKTNKGSE